MFSKIIIHFVNLLWTKHVGVVKGTVSVVSSAKMIMPDAQRYPWKLYNIYNIVVFLGFTSDNLCVYALQKKWKMHIYRETKFDNNKFLKL